MSSLSETMWLPLALVDNISESENHSRVELLAEGGFLDVILLEYLEDRSWRPHHQQQQ
jgi:hypothetical protein